MAATHSSSLLKRAVALLILAIPALAALGVVGPTSPARAATDGKGYWEVASDGGIFSFGDATFQGSMGGSQLNQPIVGMAAHPSGDGYWFVAADGGIFGFGDAKFFGSMGGSPLNRPIVGMAAHPSGEGYWLVADDGGVFSFGASKFFGSMGGSSLNQPIVGMAAHPSGNGYWFVAADGGIFSFGDATFFGSMGGSPLNQPIVGMAAHPSGNGYWFVARDGGIFSFGASKFFGSMGGERLNLPIVGMAAHPSGDGYWFVASDGGIFSFGDSKFFGSMGGSKLNRPVVGMAATPDSTKPTATVNQAAGQEDPTDAGSVEFTVTFSEPVSGFTASDVTIGGTAGATTATVSGGPNTYAVSVTGMANDGTVTVSIPAGAAVDSSGNGNAVATSTDNSVTYDNTDPGATVTKAEEQDDPTNEAPIDFTVVFSEPVTGFTADDVALNASSTPGDEAATVTGSGTTYTVSVSGMTGSGDVTVTVPAGGAFDAAGNGNTDSSVPTGGDNTVAYDTGAPSATVSTADGQESPTDEETIDFKVVFNEPVTGFATGDVVPGGTAPGTKTATITGEGTTYNVTVTGVTGEGTVTVKVDAGKANDSAGNPNVASNEHTINVDRTGPSVSASKASTQDDPTDDDTIDFTVTFTEVVTGFVAGDVALTTDTGANTVVVTNSGDSKNFNVAVSGMTSDGPVAITVSPGAAQDAAGNSSTGTTTASVTYDSTAPTPTLAKASAQEDPTDEPAIDFTVVFDEAVIGFDNGADDVDVTGAPGGTATIGDAGDNDAKTYTVTVTGMTGTGGPVTVGIPQGAAADLAGNPSNASTPATVTVTYDNSDPTFDSIAASEGSPIVVATFSEPVLCSTVQASDFAAGGGASVLTATCSGTTDNTIDLTLDDERVGGETVQITYANTSPATAITDQAGNEAPTATRSTTTVSSFTVTVKKAVGQADPTNDNTLDFTVTFNKPVAANSFQPGDVTVTGTATYGTRQVVVTSSDQTVFNVAVSGMTTNTTGDVTVSVGAGKVQDAGGNLNAASTPDGDDTVRYDSARPTTTVTKAETQQSPTKDATIDFVVTFSEPVLNFSTDDIDVAGSANEEPEASVTITPNGTMAYDVAVDATGNGSVTLEVITAGDATDVAGNEIQAAGPASVTLDTTQPDATIAEADGQGDPTSEPSIDFKVTFTEPVFGLTADDFTVTVPVGSATPSKTLTATGSPLVYTVSITGVTADGDVTLSLPAGRALDEAGNANTASTSADGGDTITRETVRPVPTVTRNDADGSTNVSPVTFTVAFGEPMTGFDQSDVEVTAPGNETYTVLANPTGTTATYTVSVSDMENGIVTAKVKEGGATDVAGNTNLASNTASVTYDTAAPTVTVGPHATQENPTDEATIEFAVVFNEDVTGFDHNDVVVGGTSGAPTTAAPGSVTGSGSTYTVAITGMTPSTVGTVTLSVNANGAQDKAGNNNAASTTPGTVTFDDVVPVFESIVANAGSTKVLAEFDEPLDCASVTATDFTAEVNDIATVITGVTCTGPSDDVIELTLSSAPAALQSVEVTLKTVASGVRDVAGNATTTQVTRSTNAAALTVTVARVGPQYKTADTFEFTITFSEPVSGLLASEVNVVANGPFTRSLTPANGPASVYTFTVDDVTDGDVSVTVPAGAATDADNTGNVASNTETSTMDSIGPKIATIEATAASENVVVTFDEDITCSTVGSGDFTVTFNTTTTPGAPAAPVAVQTAACDTGPFSETVTLTLATPAPSGTSVKVSITNGVSDRTGNASQSSEASDMA